MRVLYLDKSCEDLEDLINYLCLPPLSGRFEEQVSQLKSIRKDLIDESNRMYNETLSKGEE